MTSWKYELSPYEPIFQKSFLLIIINLIQFARHIEYPEYICITYIKGFLLPYFHPNAKSVFIQFQEMFSICMRHYQKTWKEMRAAKLDDIKKVTNVIRQQVMNEITM